MPFRLPVFTLCVFSLLIIHQAVSQDLFCTTIPQCQLIIKQLNQANQDLQTLLTGQSPYNATSREEPTEFPLPGDTSEFQNSFIPSEEIVNYNSYDIPATGTFYLQVKNLENGTSSVYLSSTCACNSTSSTSQPTSDENCMSSVAKNNYLIETASTACTVYYAINSPSEVSAATIWFYPLESLPVNTPTKINLPFPNFPRTFIYIFGPDNILATFYLSVTSIEPSTLTNIYITSDCDTACAEGDSFTKFPSQSQNCWVGTADGALTVFNFYVTRSCTFYYTLESPLIGNITATMSAYKTEPLLNDTSTILDFPLNGQYRTFVQDININEVFYISSYPFKTSTTTHVYITSNCTDTCADSTEYTNYPVINQHCWDSQEKYYFVVSTFCRIYYSVYSSVSGQVAEITGTMYSLLNLPLGTVYGVDFPFAGAYRWFYTDVNPANLSQVLITGQKVDTRIDSRIFVSTNCTLNCFESLSYSHYPTFSNNCGAGTDQVLVPVNATAPCRIFYAVYSSASGVQVYVQTQDGSSS